VVAALHEAYRTTGVVRVDQQDRACIGRRQMCIAPLRVRVVARPRALGQ